MALTRGLGQGPSVEVDLLQHLADEEKALSETNDEERIVFGGGQKQTEPVSSKIGVGDGIDSSCHGIGLHCTRRRKNRRRRGSTTWEKKNMVHSQEKGLAGVGTSRKVTNVELSLAKYL